MALSWYAGHCGSAGRQELADEPASGDPRVPDDELLSAWARRSSCTCSSVRPFVSFGRYPERHNRLVEAIALIRQLWTGERVSFAGRYYRTEQLKLYDLPVTPPPIYVAASGPKSAALAGTYGDGWITSADVDAPLRTTH
jgi:hypothetical protein